MSRTRNHRTASVLVTAMAAMMMILAVGVAPSAEATGCWVRNVRTGVGSTDLQAAIDASQQRDVLSVHGVCGAFQTYERTIKLVGPATIGYPDEPGWGHPTEILASVSGGHVTLKDLLLVGGYSTHSGGAIYNQGGTVVLTGHTRVAGNLAEDGGGGVYNEGRLVMQGRAAVADNELLFGYGGGILNEGVVIMRNRATVTGNDAFPDGGGVYNAGTLVMRDVATVDGNTADTGGGVYSTGRVIMGGSSSITHNTASSGAGGGIYSTGSVWFSDWWRGTVCDNSPDDWPTCTP